MKAYIEGFPDAIVADDLSDEAWLDLRRQQATSKRLRTKALFFCVGCGGPMHPKQNRLDTRYFAHNPESPDSCAYKLATAGESEEHKRLKRDIYRAVRSVRGWDADIEVAAPESDVVTHKPVIVDVVASRKSARPRAGVGALQGFEVQLGRMSDGEALTRQELRERWLARCTWVTNYFPAWFEELPWYELRKVDGHGDLVIGGVVRWDEALRDYVDEDPFPAPNMVKSILRGARWVKNVGWELAYSRAHATRRSTKPRRRDVLRAVQEYCDRAARVPDFAEHWTDPDWRRYALFALDRRARGEKLSDLERLAIARCPTLELIDEVSDTAGDSAYDMRHRHPCVGCNDLVEVSASVEYPIHHHCAWHLARGDLCFAGGRGVDHH